MEILRPARGTAPAPKDATAAVTVLPQDMVLVPLVGRIAAGPPILAEENFEDFIPLPSWLQGLNSGGLSA